MAESSTIVPAGSARSLSAIYRHFGEVDVADNSPLYQRVAIAFADSEDALHAIEEAPPLKRHPTVILASLHDLVLQGRAPALADAYAARDLDAAGPAAIDALLSLTAEVVAIATHRQTQTNETGRCARLYPGIAEAAARAGAGKVGLIDVGCSAGLNLSVDRVGVAYSNGQFLGDESSRLRLECEVVGERAIPDRSMPTVVARVGVDLNPVDPQDPADARWLHACLWPDQPERVARLNAAIALAADAPATLLAGDALEVLPDAFARVPADALPVVTTTWALSYFSLEGRLRFLRRLDEAAAGRTVAWVSGEGVGIAPSVPTLGDSRLAAHSLVGVALFERGSLRVEAVGRCHPHGRWLEWLAD
jgi:hypothetical protein